MSALRNEPMDNSFQLFIYNELCSDDFQSSNIRASENKKKEGLDMCKGQHVFLLAYF